LIQKRNAGEEPFKTRPDKTMQDRSRTDQEPDQGLDKTRARQDKGRIRPGRDMSDKMNAGYEPGKTGAR
jgi:hypothetical protein